MPDCNFLTGASARPVTAPAVAQEAGRPKKGGIFKCLPFLRPANSGTPRSRFTPPVSSLNDGRSRIQELMPSSRASGQPAPIQEPHEPGAQEPHASGSARVEQMGSDRQAFNVLPSLGEFMFQNWQVDKNPLSQFFPRAFTGRGTEYENIGKLLDTCNQEIQSIKDQDPKGSAAIQKLSRLHKTLTKLQMACDRYSSNPKHKNKARNRIMDRLGKEQAQTMLDTVRHLQTELFLRSLPEDIEAYSNDAVSKDKLVEKTKHNIGFIVDQFEKHELPLTLDSVQSLQAFLRENGMENIFGEKAKAAENALHSIEHKLTGENILAAELAKLAGRTELADLRPEQFWKMSMDMNVWDSEWYGFEDEPGYMGGMARGWAQMLQEVDAPLTIDMLTRMHDAAVDGVKRKKRGKEEKDNESLQMESVPKGLRSCPGSFNLYSLKPGDEGHKEKSIQKKGYPANLTAEGLKELLQKPHFTKCDVSWLPDGTQLAVSVSFPHVVEFDEKKGQARIHSNTVEEPLINQFINNYNNEIKSAQNDDDKLRAIAKLVQEFEQAHIFEDANCRTTGFLLVNKLLVQNNISPTIIEDPNWFDGFSVAQLVDAIKAGQKRFKEYIAGGDLY